MTELRVVSRPLPKLRRHRQVWFPDPAAFNFNAVTRLRVIRAIPNRVQGDRIPGAGELEFAQVLRILAIPHFVELDQGNRRLEVLIAEQDVRASPELEFVKLPGRECNRGNGDCDG